MKVGDIGGRRASLRGWDPRDADWYVEARDETTFRFTTEVRDLAAEDVRDAIERFNHDPTVAVFAIVDEVGSLAGNLSLEFTDDQAEISYFLAPEGRGRGLATEAVELATGWAFERGATRVIASVAVGNDRSAAVLGRAGFERAGSASHAALGTVTTWVRERLSAAEG